MRHIIFLLNLILVISFFLSSCEKKKEYVNIAFPDGRTYEGEWKMGNPNGQGEFIYPNLGKYVGEFKDGFPHGKGEFTWSNGRKYEGLYSEGKPHGRGTEVFPDGKKYVGEYKEGRWNGIGTITYSDGGKYVFHANAQSPNWRPDADKNDESNASGVRPYYVVVPCRLSALLAGK